MFPNGMVSESTQAHCPNTPKAASYYPLRTCRSFKSFLTDYKSITKMTNSTSKSKKNSDWREVLIEVIITILTLGFSHIRKHQDGNEHAS